MTPPGSTAEIPPPAAPPARRWQFSLRLLLLAMLVLGVLFGLFAIRLERARRQAVAVATIRSFGGNVKYDFQEQFTYQDSSVPASLLAVAGLDFFHQMVQVGAPNEPPRSPGDIPRYWDSTKQLPHVRTIHAHGSWVDRQLASEALSQCDEVRGLLLTEAELLSEDLRVLGSLTALEAVVLAHNQIDHDGVAELCKCPKLVQLDLRANPITDRAASHFGSMTQLRWLDLSATMVGDDTMAKLAALKRLTVLNVRDTLISDAGLMSLTKLPLLNQLDVTGTKVKSAGIRKFRVICPGVTISGP